MLRAAFERELLQQGPEHAGLQVLLQCCERLQAFREAGTLREAHNLIVEATMKVLCRQEEDIKRREMMLAGRDDPGNFMTGPDETYWQLTPVYY